jgi:DNA primase
MSLDGLLCKPERTRSLAETAARYHQNVIGAASYLESRGLGPSDADSFLLGLVSDPAPGHERFAGMLSIPYVLHDGGVVGFKFRRIDGSEGPKYDSPAGQKARLYNARSLADGGPVAVVCEGELDAVAAQGAFSVPSVGVPGVSAWEGNPHWARCFADFDRVLVVADHDAKEDGSDPGLKHAHRVVKDIPGAELVTPPPGHDLTSWLLQDGAEAVREACGL